MRVFITGATGLVGSHTAERLKRDGHEIITLVRKTSDTRHLQEQGATLVVGDVTDRASIERALVQSAPVDAVVHAAAVVLSETGEWAHYEEVGVRGTENVVRAMHAAGVKRLIHISSTAVYGMGKVPPGLSLTEEQPMMHDCPHWNHYVREKVLAEDLVWSAHKRGEVVATTLRPGVVFGLRDRNCTPGILKNLQSPKGALVGTGNNIVSHVAVQDVASAVSLALVREASVGRAYNIVDPAHRSQAELYKLFADASGLSVPTIHTPPLPVAVLIARTFNFMHRVRSRPGPKPFDPISATVWGSDGPVDSSRATAELGWRAEISAQDTVVESVQWHRSQSTPPPRPEVPRAALSDAHP